MRIPERGDILVVDFDPQSGHEQAKRRPALVLSTAAFNVAFGLAWVVPITSKPKGHAFEVLLPGTERVRGAVMAHHLKSLDWEARRARFAARAPARIVDEVVQIIKDIIE